MNKTDLINALREKHQQWEALLDEVGAARMNQPGVNGGWSMKDLIAHLTGWQHRVVNEIQAASRGEPKPPPPWPAHLQAEDDINAWIYESNRARSVNEVLDEARRVNQQTMALMEQLPDDVQVERVDPSDYLVWVGGIRFPPGEFFDHFIADHAENVRAWLAQVKEH